MLHETLHAVRDFLTVNEAADLSAQLPLLIRGMFFDGWIPAKTPAKRRSPDDFVNRVMKSFPMIHWNSLMWRSLRLSRCCVDRSAPENISRSHGQCANPCAICGCDVGCDGLS